MANVVFKATIRLDNFQLMHLRLFAGIFSPDIRRSIVAHVIHEDGTFPPSQQRYLEYHLNMSSLLFPCPSHYVFHFFYCVQVLITKLRSANTQETRQYHKASKALLVLIPLFGITYLLVMVGPEQGISRYLFACARSFLISTQVSNVYVCVSVYVCILYCTFKSYRIYS